MAAAFRDDVEEAFAFLHVDPGYQLLDSETSTSFDNAAVFIRSDRLRLRIVRERSQVFADFAPPDGPPLWFDAPLVAQYLGYEALAAAHTQSDQRSLGALAAFVRPLCAAIGEFYTSARREDRSRPQGPPGRELAPPMEVRRAAPEPDRRLTRRLQRTGADSQV